jgi:hypothetical protein
MTDNVIDNMDLKKMKRADLLEIMVSLSKENESLKSQLDEVRDQLEKKEIQIDEAGSIAEAALQLNGVFEAAERAGKEYLENIARLSEEKEIINARIIAESETKASAIMAETKTKAASLMAETQVKSEKMERDAAALMENTRAECAKLERDTKVRCEGMVLQAEKEAREHWDKVSEKLEAFYKQHEGLNDIMSFIAEKGE